MRPFRFYHFAILGLVFSACGEDVSPLGDGSLQTTWQISPRGCDDSGVTHVEINIEGADSRREIFGCDVSHATLDQLAPGNYRVRIDGIDEAGKVIFTAPTDTVTVKADRIATAPHALLTAKPASFELSWRFENGRVCGANSVTDIEVIVFDKSDYEIGRDTYVCNDGEGVIEGFTAGAYLIEATTEGSGQRFRGLASASVDRGDSTPVELVLSVDSE